MSWWTLRKLNSSDVGTRTRAAEELGNSGNIKAVERLISALDDSEKNVRVAAAQALGKIGDGKALQPLITALSDHYADVRRAAADALKTLEDKPADDAARAIVFVAGQEWNNAIELGAVAVGPLIAVLEKAALEKEGVDWRVKKDALGALIKIGDSGAVESLIAALQNSFGDVRDNAALALGKIGDPRAVEPLITALKDSDQSVRQEAALALGKIGDPRAIEPLITALKDSDQFVRQEAALALGKIGDPRAVEPLITALKDSKESVREAASSSLSSIGTPEAESAVLKYVQRVEITTQEKALSLPEALIFVERTARDAIGGEDLPPIQPAVMEVLRRDGRDAYAQGMETEVALFSVLVMNLVWFTRCNALILTDSESTAQAFFEKHLFTASGPNGEDFAARCGKTLRRITHHDPNQDVRDAFKDHNTIPVMELFAFESTYDGALLDFSLSEGLGKLNCVVKVWGGTVSADEEVGFLPVLTWAKKRLGTSRFNFDAGLF